MNVTCQCGHTADLDQFTRTHTGELAPCHYQCPACHRAWRVVKTPIVITRWGTVISDRNKIEAVQAAL